MENRARVDGENFCEAWADVFEDKHYKNVDKETLKVFSNHMDRKQSKLWLGNYNEWRLELFRTTLYTLK